jgi:hypothetical protein
MQAMGSQQPGSLVGEDRSLLQVSGRPLQVVWRGEGRRRPGLQEGPCAVCETPAPPCPIHTERHLIPRQVPQPRRKFRPEAGTNTHLSGSERRILQQLPEAYPEDPRLDRAMGGERILCPGLLRPATPSSGRGGPIIRRGQEWRRGGQLGKRRGQGGQDGTLDHASNARGPLDAMVRSTCGELAPCPGAELNPPDEPIHD